MKKSIKMCNDWFIGAGIVAAISAIGAFIGAFVAMFGYGTFIATICIVGLIFSILIAAIVGQIGLTISEEMEEKEEN